MYLPPKEVHVRVLKINVRSSLLTEILQFNTTVLKITVMARLQQTLLPLPCAKK